MAVSGDTHRQTATALVSGMRATPRSISARGPALLIIFWVLAVWPVLPVLALDEPFLDADAHQLLAAMADEVEHLRWVMGGADSGPCADQGSSGVHT
ncbi:hypothetical protein [Rhabdochromatium marinum]|uniref:hypothetical protein n=1 Tax=Rhabdochromatium marinum TaxID=48729 RepID=UPI0019063650|nr:hypothetical protein [Rhabdochromatium marinum]MBK1649950.1 hypothetical protein [Rhabdochromatium marinum]